MILLHCLIISLIIFFSGRLLFPNHFKISTVSLLLKVGASLFIVWYFLEGVSHDTDIQLYIHDGILISEYTNMLNLVPFDRSNDPVFYQKLLTASHQSRTFYHAVIIGVFFKFTQNNIYLTGLYFSLFSAICGLFLTREITKNTPVAFIPVLFSVVLFPSVLIFTSGHLKECIAFGFLCLLVVSYLNIRKKWLSGHWVMLILSGGYLLVFKNYVLAALIPAMLIDFISLRSAKYLKFSINNIQALAVITFVGVGFLMLYVNNAIGNAIYRNYEATLELSGCNSCYELEGMGPDIKSIINNVFPAVFHSLFRPFPWEAKHAYMTLASVENTLLLVMIIVGIYLTIKHKIKPGPLVVPALFYVIILSVLLGLSSPNYGALIRYRTIFIPFLVLPCLHIIFSYISKKKQPLNEQQ